MRFVKRLFIFSVLSVVLAGAAVAALGRDQALEMVFGPVLFAPVDFETLKLTEKPNQYLVCPSGACGGQAHGTSPRFDLPVADLRAKWFSLLKQVPRIEPVKADEDLMQYDFIQRSELLHFPDSITVRFLSLEEGGSTLMIYSRSNYGHSDLGVNENRIRRWLAVLQ